MSRKEREEAVATLSRRLQDTSGLIVLDYKGLDVDAMTGLRRQIKEAGSEIKVAKNTLLRIASSESGYDALNEHYTGQTAVTFVDGDPAQAAKVLTKFMKEYKKGKPDAVCQIKGGMLETQVLGVEQLEELGNLPSREVLLGQLVGLLASPMRGLVTVLSEIPGKFVRSLAAIEEQKKGAE